MARTVAELPKGSRITDYISLGVLNTMIPRTAVNAALEASSRQSIRQRDLPAHVMVYYVVALALYMQSSYREVLRCLLEGLQWLSDPSARPRVVGKSGISQARTRLGAEPLQALHDAVVRPVGRSSEPGCGYRRWHLVSIDGSGLDVADEQGKGIPHPALPALLYPLQRQPRDRLHRTRYRRGRRHRRVETLRRGRAPATPRRRQRNPPRLVQRVERFETTRELGRPARIPQTRTPRTPAAPPPPGCSAPPAPQSARGELATQAHEGSVVSGSGAPCRDATRRELICSALNAGTGQG